VIYFDEARKYFNKSNCLKRRYSAVIIDKNGVAVGAGVNQSMVACETCARENIPHNTGNYNECQSVHAEQFAMLQAGKDRLDGSTLYLVCDQDQNPKPCPICQRMMDWCGVRQEIEGSDG